MPSSALLRFCLLILTHAAAGLQSTDQLMDFALLGDSVTLPCALPAIKSCSSINWRLAGDHGSFTEVVQAGKVMGPKMLRLGLQKDCSLQINDLKLSDAGLYFCDSGGHNSSVFLRALQIAEIPDDVTIELQCFLNTYKGYVACNTRELRMTWSAEDNAPLNGKRFRLEESSACFSKLLITKKLTDHHRRWKCHLFQNDTRKATISYTTAVKDGLEEVFAAVGESVSLSCGNTSSLDVGGSTLWAVGERSVDKGQTMTFQPNKDSSLVISKVSALHTGDYQCSESTDHQKVFNRIRLHTLDVTSESWAAGDNLTLTCVLTCTETCEEDFSLTWSGRGQNSWQSDLVNTSNTLRNRLFLPGLVPDDVTCLVLREGNVVASKKWRAVNPLQTAAWLALPLGLLIAVAAGGLYFYKRKQHSDAEDDRSSIGMTPVYEDIQDVNYEEDHQQRLSKQEAATNTSSFYDLLQAVS